MKKFSYKLDPLLRIKKFQEKIVYGDYAKVLGRVNQQQQVIMDAGKKASLMVEIQKKEMKTGLIDPVEKKYQALYFRRLSQVKETAQEKIHKESAELEEKRLIAEKARKERRVLEILKEKQIEEYKVELARYEQKELDEFNSRKKGWKQG